MSLLFLGVRYTDKQRGQNGAKVEGDRGHTSDGKPDTRRFYEILGMDIMFQERTPDNP